MPGGRPKGSKNKHPGYVHGKHISGQKTPLEYMLAVMNDETADKLRRDRMAVAAAPFVHPKIIADIKERMHTGKKEQAAINAEDIVTESNLAWGTDLQSETGVEHRVS